MNKYILLSLIVTAAAFGAAHDKSTLNTVLNTVIEAARRNDTQAVLTQGARLNEKDQRLLASDLDFLNFIVAKIETKEITQGNKSEYLELFPIIGNKLGVTAITTGKTDALRAYLNQEYTRIETEANEKKQAEAARIEQEEAAAREAQAQEAVNFERLRNIKIETRKFTDQINRYSNAKTPDDREAVLSEICTIGAQLCTLDKTGFTTLTQEGTAFYNLVSYFMTHNRIHELRRIKYEIPNLHTSILSLIDALITEHEDSSAAYRSSQPSNNLASSSASQAQIPTSSSYEPVLTSQENEMRQLPEMSEADLANQMALLPDNTLAELLSSPNLLMYPELCDKMTSAVLREQERRYNATNENIAPLPAENFSDTDDLDEETRLAIEQSLLQENSSEHDQPAINQLQIPFNNEEESDDEDLELALALSQTSPSALSNEHTEQPTQPETAQPNMHAENEPVAGTSNTPIIATGLTAAACALGAYLWNRYASQ